MDAGGFAALADRLADPYTVLTDDIDVAARPGLVAGGSRCEARSRAVGESDLESRPVAPLVVPTATNVAAADMFLEASLPDHRRAATRG